MRFSSAFARLPLLPSARTFPVGLGLCCLASLAGAQSTTQAKVPRPRSAQPEQKLPAPQYPSVPVAPVVLPGSQSMATRPAHTDKVAPPSGWNASAPRPGAEAVLFDTPGDGALWARGRDYKVSFQAEGASIVPFLGSCVESDHPLTLALESARVGDTQLEITHAIEPLREGTRVSYDRGALRELFDLAPEGIEHSFVLESLPASGDLVLRLNVASDLAPSASSAGCEFAIHEGGLRYGQAWLVDAHGSRTSATTQWKAGAIEIRVAAAALAGASFPLTIDPWISAFAIDTSVADTYYADVAYDASTDRYAFVYTQVYSATDNDVYIVEYTPAGAYVSGSLQTIDYTTNAWYNAKIANNRLAAQFLTVAIVWPAGGGTHQISGRTSDAASSTLGTQFQISPADSYEKFFPDVGGDASLFGPTYYLVAWTRVFTSTDDDIHAQLVTTAGTLQGPLIYVDNSGSTLDEYPSVSKTDGLDPFTSQTWNIVWERIVASNDFDILGASYAWDGTQLASTFPIATGPTDDFAARVSTIQDDLGNPRRYLVTWMSGNPSHDVLVAVMEGATVLGVYNLNAMEGVAQALDQNGPSVDCDGRQFALAYAESFGGSTTDYDIYEDTLALVGTSLALTETRAVVTTSSNFDFYPNIAAAHAAGGPSNTYGIAWTSGNGATGSGPYDVYGGVWSGLPFASFCFPGEDAIACPCGNAPAASGSGCENSATTGGAILSASGSPIGDTVILHASGMLPSATCIFLQGDGLAAGGIAFGDGVRCAGGQLLRLKVAPASSGAADYPSGSDLSITQRCIALGAPISGGTERYYQTYYRDPQNFACALPATFNITNAVQVPW